MKDQIKKAIDSTNSMRQACLSMGINYKAFKRKAIEFGLWSPNQSGKNGTKRKHKIENILVENSIASTCTIKRYVIEDELLEYKCNSCGIADTWNNKPISLELDHINGISNDHRLENLRILCPNCHSQTPTFRGRNIKLPE